MHKKLFIPGPSEVRDEVLKATAQPMIGHRSSDFVELYKRVIPKLQQCLYTKEKVFLFTSSSSGVMEGAVRNCCSKRALCCVSGAFSKRWYDMAVANGIEADMLEVEWGKAIKPEMVDKALATGKYDCITFVHNETSTGVMHPLYEVAEVMKKYPDVLFLVDAVSSMMGVKIEVDKLGIDVCLAGVQKCWALPPGLTVASISKKAIEKAKTIKHRGYYFDFLEFLKYDEERQQTPTTPAISLVYGLDVQTDRILAEGLDNRFNRHLEMAKWTREWAKEHFTKPDKPALYPEPGYESVTLTTVNNTVGKSVADLNKELGKRGFQISNGYGKIKELTFRIAHMGDLTLQEVQEVCRAIEEIWQV